MAAASTCCASQKLRTARRQGLWIPSTRCGNRRKIDDCRGILVMSPSRTLLRRSGIMIAKDLENAAVDFFLGPAVSVES